MSVNNSDPAKQIARAAGAAILTLSLCAAALLPAAFAVTRGLLPAKNDRIMTSAAILISAFLTGKILWKQKGEKEWIKALLSSALVYVLLLLLSAGMSASHLSLHGSLPAAACAAAGYFAAISTNSYKRVKMRKHRKKAYYR